MNLQNLICATIVFVAYCRLGYYRWFGFLGAVRAYFHEQRHLAGDILKITRAGVPIGTLMCSVDRGWLPVDLAFPAEMAKLRQGFHGRIAYFGKFAVIPSFQGKLVGKLLMKQAALEWSPERGVDVAVMMVNPSHVPIYRRLGAIEIARTEGTIGLDKAPAVLMLLEYEKSAEVQRWRRESARDQPVRPLEAVA